MGALAILTGIAAGIGGLSLALILHWIQHLAYGYSLQAIISPESFLQGVSNASPFRRLTMLGLCGLVAGVGWPVLARYGRPLVSVTAAVGKALRPMPVGETLVHGLLQIVTVALGSPLGREVAPREYGALFAQRVCALFGAPADELRILVACGSGAGLAAVYNVPLAAIIFVMEVLLRRVELKIVVAALLSCFVAAYVSRLGLGNEVQYPIPYFTSNGCLLLISLIVGPLVGGAGVFFRRWTSGCSARAATGLRQVAGSLIAFVIVGALSMIFPQLLGNGKGLAELAFTDNLTLGFAALLVLTKLLSITIVLRAGARGGLLTPGLSIGALLAIMIGALWNQWLPNIDLGAVALVGAAAFLSCSMAMPLTAMLIAVEFTAAPATLYVPIAIGVLGASAVQYAIGRYPSR
ncbi:H+/Cl- antiporter ClcA [Rhizobium sp. BK512]|uniref:chloride channel protein n=1 Tax=Rhizobium sp. BK512 TaxID=2587010 RepID=UPI0017C04833|nr:chloride channel protein [Rhizobium sp. BK512]MBB3562781.1 H+/Cl- antiporter ClcA [Rhizobium sp. BK512]